MAKLIFKLRDVSVDELSEVHRLLEEHAIDVYETQGGVFGLSLAGLWVSNDDDFERARSLLDTYAAERQLALRSKPHESLLQFWFRKPAQAALAVLSLVLILFFSVWPFIHVGGE